MMKENIFSLRCTFLIIVAANLLAYITKSQTLSFNISSSSTIVSQTTNFTYSNINIALTNQSNIEFIFTVNGAIQTRTPYYSNFSIALNGQVLTTCTNFVATYSVSCNLNKNITSNWSLILTNARNPPSTKPYYVTLSIATLGKSYIANKTITLTQVPTSQLLLLTMNKNIGVNTSATFFFSPIQPFITNTLVNFTFPSFVNPQVPGTSTDYSLTKISNTTLTATSWTALSSSGRSITFNLTNPEAAIVYTISYTISFFQNITQYQVQKGSGSVQLTASSFTSLSKTGSIVMGIPNNITFVGACPFSAVSPFKITATYNNAQISISNCIVSTSNSSLTICNSTTSSTTLLLTNFTAGLLSTTTITITSYTTFNSSLQPLCSSSNTLNIVPQTLANPGNLQANQGCSKYQVNQNNTVTIIINAYQVQVGDIVQIGLDRNLAIQNSSWNKSSTISQTVNYYTHIILTNQINTGSSPAVIQISLTYTNPSYLISIYGLLSAKLYRSTLSFAQTSTNSTSIVAQLCPVNTTGNFTNFNYSNSPTALTTYATFNWYFSIVLSLIDYTTQDYISILIDNAFSAFENSKFKCEIQSKNCNFTIISSNQLYIYFTSLTNISSLNLTLSNILNPIKINTPPIFSIITYSSARSSAKQSYKFQPISTLNSFPANILLSQVLLNTNSTVTLQISNQYRSFVYNDSQGNGAIQATVPFKCLSAVNTSTSLINVSITSSNSTQTKIIGVWLNDGSVSFGLSFGNCAIPFFNSSAINYTATFSESFSGTLASSSTSQIKNACGGDCYQCNAGTTCTLCLNSSYTINIVLFQGSCYISCPSYSYQLSSTQCIRCNSPCKACTGSTSSNCKTCVDNFELKGTVCVSVCGDGLYFLNGSCLNCHVNCLNCLNQTYCFQCKVNAVMLPTNMCQFTNCTSPCLTCQSTMTTCTSCIDSLYYYNKQCFSKCPDKTYVLDENAKICSDIKGVTLYFPMTIAGLIVLFVGLGLKLFLNNPNLQIINLLGVIFSYIQLFANGFLLGYAINTAVIALTVLVYIIGCIMNIIYVISYFIKRKYTPQTPQQKEVKIQTSPLKPNKSEKKQQITKNNTRSNLSKSKSKSKVKDNENQGASKVNLKPAVQQIISQISEDLQDTYQQITWKEILLLTLCGIFTLRTHRVVLSGLFKSKIQKGKKVSLIIPHPPYFLFWVTVLTLLFLTLPQMIAAIIQLSLVPVDYLSKLFIGLDTLIVVLFSSTLRIWDLCKWKWDSKFFVAPFGNATQENMKTYLDDQQANRKTLQEARQTKKIQYSPKKSIKKIDSKSLTIHKNKSSPKNGQARSGIKIDDNELPDVKIFDAIDDGQDFKIKGQKLKKWNAGIKNRNTRMSHDNMRMKKSKMNWKLEDIYLGFVDPDAPENQNEDIDLQNLSDDRTQAYLKGTTKANFRDLQDHLEDQITNQDNFDDIEVASKSPKTVINQFIIKSEQKLSQQKQQDQNQQQEKKQQQQNNKDNLDFNIEDL